MTDKVGATFLHRGWLFCVIEDNQAAICLMYLLGTTRRITLVCKMVSVDYLNRTGKLGA